MLGYRWVRLGPHVIINNGTPHKFLSKPYSTNTTTGLFYEQVAENQQRYGKHLLMARVGDFYEFYFDQARTVSQLLGLRIAIGKYRGKEHQFCGFPSYKMTDYTRKLLDMGYSVAKYEQYHTHQPNGAQTISRKVDRIYSPGNIIEDDLMSDDTNANFTMAIDIVPDRRELVFSCIDICSGQFYCDTIPLHLLDHVLSSFSLSQVIMPAAVEAGYSLSRTLARIKSAGALINYVDSTSFCNIKAKEYLNTIFGKSRDTRSKDEERAIGALLSHIIECHGGRLPVLSKPVKFDRHRLQIDRESCNSLELISSSKTKSKNGSLLQIMDHTATAVGRKELISRIRNPYASKAHIENQLDVVDMLQRKSDILERSVDVLKSYFRHDPVRALQNLKMGNAGLWHIGVIRDAINGHMEIRKIYGHEDEDLFSKISQISGHDGEDEDWRQIETDMLDLRRTLDQLIPTNETDLPKKFEPPGMLNFNCNEELLEIKAIFDKVKSSKVSLESDLKERYLKGVIANISLEFKKPLGAYVEIETTKENHDVLSKYDELICIQSLGETKRMRRRRYQAAAWVKLASEIREVEEMYQTVETRVFSHICDTISLYKENIIDITKLAEAVDVSCSLATAAKKHGLSRPRIVDKPTLNVVKGFHPNFSSSNLQFDNFKKNNCLLDIDNPMAVITGANMAGKSTFLRQNALIIIMSHIGSFVPAQQAEIGLCDKVFSRLTGSDDINRNESSFMVEMNEAAFILRNATNKSFVILDEIGRATSYEDGISLAYGIAKHLNSARKCRTLFATHYRDLAAEFERKNIKCLQSRVIKKRSPDGKVTPCFTYQFIDGVAENSFGFHVAELAGVPDEVIRQSSAFREKLYSTNRNV